MCCRMYAPTGGDFTNNAVEGFHSNLKKYYLTSPKITG